LCVDYIFSTLVSPAGFLSVTPLVVGDYEK